jgi:hypothetical protein
MCTARAAHKAAQGGHQSWQPTFPPPKNVLLFSLLLINRGQATGNPSSSSSSSSSNSSSSNSSSILETRLVVAVPIVARILETVFDSDTSILGSPGVILTPLGSILVALGSILVALGSPLTPKGSPAEKERFSGGLVPSVWVPILVHFRVKNIKTQFVDRCLGVRIQCPFF